MLADVGIAKDAKAAKIDVATMYGHTAHASCVVRQAVNCKQPAHDAHRPDKAPAKSSQARIEDSGRGPVHGLKGNETAAAQ